MTVEQSELIDAIGTDNATGEVVLSILDHLPWTDEHIRVLNMKFATYSNFIKGGGLSKEFGCSGDSKIKILLLLKFRPNRDGEDFLEKVRLSAIADGWNFSFQPIPKLGYANDAA